MKTILLISQFTLILTSGIFAQQDPMVSQYMFNGLYLNPAYSGTHNYWTSTINYRSQWVGINGAPETAILSVDGPLMNQNMGLGFTLMRDRIGVTTQHTFTANYGYQLKINPTTKFAFGANVGFSQFSAKLTELTVWENDKVFQNDIASKVLPKFGAGIYLYSSRYYAGFSIPTLVAYQKGVDFNIDLSRSSFLRRHYLVTAGYVFGVSQQVKFKPSFLIKFVQHAPVQIDLNFSAVWKDKYWVGFSYRSGDAAVAILEYQTGGNFRIGYAYDLTVSKLRNYSSGSHEIMLGIDLGKQMVKVKTPRYF